MDSTGVKQDFASLDFSEILNDCFNCGVIVLGPDGRISGINPEAEEMTGIPASQALHCPLSVLPKGLQETLLQMFREKGAGGDRNVSLRTESGMRCVRLRVTSFPDAGTGSGLTVILLHDFSAAEKLGTDIQRLDRLASIGTLSASMAHEIKNALVAVQTFVEDLLQRNKDAELSGLVRREVRRIDTIAVQMLKFAGPAKPTFLPVSVHRILNQSLRLIQPQLESKAIRLQRSFSAPRDIVEGDAYQLEQVFMNMFLNAVAAMENQGQLSVSTELTAPPADENLSPDDRELQVIVRDTGCGIPEENLNRLFEPFFTTKPQGTGLGLAITRRIILDHRGRVAVESKVNQGTTFRLSLPLSAKLRN